MYLDAWVNEKINKELSTNEPLTRGSLDVYTQIKRLELLAFLLEKSPFYQKHLTDVPPFTDDTVIFSKQWAAIPFTSSENLIHEGMEMLCVHPGEIQRIVTQTTSGTTGPAKRIYFTSDDQELTRDYFHHGIKIMIHPLDSILILLPHKSPGSLGFLLQESLSRLGATGYFMDSLDSKGNLLFAFDEIKAIVGLPSLILNLANTHPKIHPHSVLMTADFVAKHDRQSIKKIWSSRIFEHYGMTEMGLGCAMSCRDTEDNPPVGYHVRENDLYLEIINPHSGKILSPGEWGEIVMTTLTRRGMPLLRYRTGDIGRWLKEPCTCGSVLKRLDRVQKRTTEKNISKLKIST